MRLNVLAIFLAVLCLGSLFVGFTNITNYSLDEKSTSNSNTDSKSNYQANIPPKAYMKYDPAKADFVTNVIPISPVNIDTNVLTVDVNNTKYQVFSVELLEGYYFNVTLFNATWKTLQVINGNYTYYQVDIDMAIFFDNTTFSTIDSWKNVTSNNNNENLAIKIPASGTYYIVLYPFESDGITFGTTLSTALLDGSKNLWNKTVYGNNNGQLVAHASTLRVQMVDEGFFSYGNNLDLSSATPTNDILPHLPELHPGQTTWLWELDKFGLPENDLYKIKIPANTTFNIYVTYLTQNINNPDPANYYLTLIDYNNFVDHGSTIGSYQRNGSNSISMKVTGGLYLSSSYIINNLTAADTDTYYIIRINGPSLDQLTFEYNITIKVTDYIDAYSPNDDPSRPFPTTELLNFTLFTNSADKDFFVLTPPSQPLRLTVDIFFDRNFGIVNLYLFNSTIRSSTDETKSLIGRSDFANQNQQEIVYNIFSLDELLIKVNSSVLYSNAYTLKITLGPIDDQYEPNNGFLQPATLYKTGPENQYNLFIAKNDYDFFRMFLFKDDQLNVTIYFDGSKADVNLFLYSDQLAPIDQSNKASSDNESVATTATKNGYYYFVVYGQVATFTLPGIDYHMIVNVIAQDDNLEPNNNKDQTVPIQDGLFHLIARAGNEDWFTIYMRSNDALTVSVNFDSSKGDIDIFLFDSKASNMFTSSQTFTNNESLSFIAPSEGNYLLRVALFDGQSLNYDMNVTLTDERYDPFEDNDNFQQATILNPGLNSSIIAQGGDYDFFKVYVPAGYAIIVELIEEAPNTGKNFLLVLYSAQEVEINRSERNLNTQYIKPVPVTSSTFFYIDAHYKGFGKTTYSLNITLGLNSVLFPAPKLSFAGSIPLFSFSLFSSNTTTTSTSKGNLFNIGTLLTIGVVGIGGGAAAGAGGTIIGQKASIGTKIKKRFGRK